MPPGKRGYHRLLRSTAIVWPLAWLVTLFVPVIPLHKGDGGPVVTFVPAALAYVPDPVWFWVAVHLAGSLALALAVVLVSSWRPGRRG